jgi:hypothetical protein
MEDNKSLRNTSKSQNQASQKTEIKKENRENHLEQAFYNKACGCSVRAQEDNLFDYKSRSMAKRHSSNELNF